MSTSAATGRTGRCPILNLGRARSRRSTRTAALACRSSSASERTTAGTLLQDEFRDPERQRQMLEAEAAAATRTKLKQVPGTGPYAGGLRHLPSRGEQSRGREHLFDALQHVPRARPRRASTQRGARIRTAGLGCETTTRTKAVGSPRTTAQLATRASP